MVSYSRKEIKKRAKKVFGKHYLRVVIMVLIASFLGVSTGSFFNIFRIDIISISSPAVFENIILGDLDSADNVANNNLSEETSKDLSLGSLEAGRSNGIFADAVNKYNSGSFMVSIARVIFNTVKHPTMAGTIFMILALIVMAIKSIFISEMFNVVLARMFLEIHLYDKANYSAPLFFLRTKTWFKVSLAYLRSNIYLFFWKFTIIGGIIKSYSYAMVKYILAENPNLTGKQAIDLSRKMMHGHKWELFLFDCSFILWDILYFFTGLLSGALFIFPYRHISRMEYYCNLRARCKAEDPEGMKLLCDDWLYEYAPTKQVQKAYKKEINVMKESPVKLPQPTKIRAFAQQVFGVVITYDKQEKQYREISGEKIRAAAYKNIVNMEAYPMKLCPTPSYYKRINLEQTHYMRHYSISSLIMIFFSFCFVGWLWEVVIHIINDGRFVNRGVLHGPWLPIYGSGAVLILLALNMLRKKPFWEFVASIALCGTIEYFGHWMLEKLFNGQKWWDYTGYFLNLNGRICAEGLLVFGLAGIACVYFIGPLLDSLFARMSPKIRRPLCLILLAVFIVDVIYSITVPNTGDGITDYALSVLHIMGA